MSNPTNAQFTNPYASIPEGERLKTTIIIGGRDKSFLAALHPEQGVMQTTVALLVTKLIATLKEHGINEYDPVTYAAAVSGATITLGTVPGRTLADPRVQAPSGDVGHGTPGVDSETPTGKGEPRRAASTPVGRRGRKEANGTRP
jgi:hypothetical protein